MLGSLVLAPCYIKKHSSIFYAATVGRENARFYDREVAKKENLTTRLVLKKNGLDPGIGTSPRFCLDERSRAARLATKIRVRQPDLTDASQVLLTPARSY